MNPYTTTNQSEIDRQIAARNAQLNAQNQLVGIGGYQPGAMGRIGAEWFNIPDLRGKRGGWRGKGIPLGALAPYLRTILK